MIAELQPSRRCFWTALGRARYPEAVALQEGVRERLLAGEGPERLLLLEHPPVYTLGRNAEHADVVASRAWLEDRSIEVFESDRGGEVTYHGPGQLVGYPILDLKPDRRDLRRYVGDLVEVLVRSLATLGIEAEGRPAPGIGVWVGDSKIASLGIHLSRWVTTHGFALNVSTDLDGFAGIVACGLPGVTMTSVEELLGRPVELGEVIPNVVAELGAVFSREMVPAAAAEWVPAITGAPVRAG